MERQLPQRHPQRLDPLQAEKASFRKLYDFDLMMNGGHLALANNALNELEELHAQLLDEDAMYRAAIIRLKPSLNLLKAKTDRPTMSDIEACLILLYQIMMLRLQKREISPETASVQEQATQVLRFLSQSYRSLTQTLP